MRQIHRLVCGVAKDKRCGREKKKMRDEIRIARIKPLRWRGCGGVVIGCRQEREIEKREIGKKIT